MAEITVEERIQNIEAFLLEDLKFDPSQVHRFYTDNVFKRTLAHIVGWTGRGAKMLRCTGGGELKTAPTTTGIEAYSRFEGVGADGWSGTFTWPQVVSRIDFFIWDNAARVKLYDANLVLLPELEIPAGFYSVDIRASQFMIANEVPGQVARYQLVGWW